MENKYKCLKNLHSESLKQHNFSIIRKKHTLKLTDLELLALIDILDSFSSIFDGGIDDTISKKSLRKVDKMLNKNGYKREFS